MMFKSPEMFLLARKKSRILCNYRFMVPGTIDGNRRNRRETPGYPESDWKGLFLGKSRAVPATQNVLEGSREVSENGLKGDGRDKSL